MAAANNDNEHVRSVEELKSAFKEGATPNEKDYGALIDLAAVGSKALGAKDATPTTPEPGAGLKMDKGKLTVSAGKGVKVDQNGVAVKGDRKSVTVTEAGVGVQVKPDGGLTTDAGEGLHVKEGAGVITTADGVAIHLAGNSGLKADKAGLAVNVATGLRFDKQGALTVKVKTGGENYITSDKDGLAITKDGVAAIEMALKSVSLDALDRADAATSHGFKVDATSAEPIDSVQKKIAVKLNEAFTEGWHLSQPREALFTALKPFRTANHTKIYNEGLIAPSAVTGYPGLYNQGGAEYTAGTVIAYKVSPSGVAEVVKSGVYTEDGIYALVGKLDKAGSPKAGEEYDYVTSDSLMVLVAKTEVTVVGHWDFKLEADWTGTTSAGGWRTGPGGDGVVKHREATTKAENAKAIEELKKEVAAKDAERAIAETSEYQRGLKDAAVEPKLEFNGIPAKSITAVRTGNTLQLDATVESPHGRVRTLEGFQRHGINDEFVTARCEFRCYGAVYGKAIENGTEVPGPYRTSISYTTDSFAFHTEVYAIHPKIEKVEFKNSYLVFTLTAEDKARLVHGQNAWVAVMGLDAFYFDVEGLDGIKTLLRVG